MKQKRKLKTSKALSSIAILEGIVIVSMVILCLVKTDLPIVESILPEQLHGSKAVSYTHLIGIMMLIILFCKICE